MSVTSKTLNIFSDNISRFKITLYYRMAFNIKLQPKVHYNGIWGHNIIEKTQIPNGTVAQLGSLTYDDNDNHEDDDNQDDPELHILPPQLTLEPRGCALKHVSILVEVVCRPEEQN